MGSAPGAQAASGRANGAAQQQRLGSAREECGAQAGSLLFEADAGFENLTAPSYTTRVASGQMPTREMTSNILVTKFYQPFANLEKVERSASSDVSLLSIVIDRHDRHDKP